MDLSAIPQEVLMARGQYSTVRGAHEDEIKRLQILCGQLSAVGVQILRYKQPDIGDKTYDIHGMLNDARLCIDAIEKCAATIDELAAQKTEIRPQAWPKN